jgi:hypothetical protein
VCILLDNGILQQLGVHGCLREVHTGEAPGIHRDGVTRSLGQRVVCLGKERTEAVDISTYGADAREDPAIQCRGASC